MGILKHKDQPLVSVIMPIYNAASFLKPAIDSILTQTYAKWELIIVDDGSTDESRIIIQTYKDQRISLICNSTNKGIGYSRNAAIQKTKGKYIAILDGDDQALPQRLALQTAFMEKNPEYVLLGGSVALIDENSRSRHILWRYSAKSSYIPAILLFENYFAQSTVMMRKDCLPFDPYDASSPQGEDYDLWIRLSQIGKIGNLTQVLTKYRVHTRNISIQRKDEMKRCIKMILAKQLKNLGIPFSDPELELHYMLHTHQNFSEIQLARVEQWLILLQQHNQKSGYYPVKIFNQVIAQQWLHACKKGITSFSRLNYRLNSSKLLRTISVKSKISLWISLNFYLLYRTLANTKLKLTPNS